MYLLIVAILALAIIIALTLYKKIKSTPVDKIHGRAAPVRREEGAALRRQQARNQRGRLRLNAAARLQDSDEENDANVNDEENEQQLPDFGDDKMGAKKRAKLEAKAEKKSQREMEQKSREDKKKREALAEEERRKIEEKEKLEEKRKEEEERSAQEEQERREHEEYLKMKEAFSVEEEGYEEAEQDEKENLLQEFIDYIKNNKVVVLEDLAAHFKLKTQAVIDRITELKKDGIITGVIDDRGKFIYISEKELNAVAKFIKQRGRVSITELAENSNTLITLDPKPTVNV